MTEADNANHTRAVVRKHLPLMLGATFVSVLLLVLGVMRKSFVTGFLLVIAGGLVGVLGLFSASALIRLLQSPARWAFRLAVAGTVITAIAISATIALLAPIGLVAFMLGLIAGYDHLADRTGRTPGWAFDIGLGALAVAPLAIARPEVLFTAAGIVVAVVGLVLFKLGVTERIRNVGASETDGAWRAAVTTRGWWALGWCLGGIALGAGLVLGATHLPDIRPGPTYQVYGVTLIVAGLSGAGLAALHIEPPTNAAASPNYPKLWWTVLLLGITATGIGTRFAYEGLAPAVELTVLFVGVGVGVGAFFVFRGEGIASVVVFGLVLTWVLTDRTVEPDVIGPAESSGMIVAFGDSFTSGQGTNRYLSNTNTRGPEGNACRRSPYSYVQLVGLQLRREVRNYACNGAKIADIVDQGQHDNLDTSQVPGALPQLDNVLHPEFGVGDAPIDLVVVSVGGNDAQFSTVVAACVLPTNCSDQRQRFEAEAELIADPFRRSLRTIRQRIGTGVPIVVLPYPNYIGDRRCELALTRNEIDFGGDFVARINHRVEGVVDDLGDDAIKFFDQLDRAYQGHRLCDDEEAANFVRLVPMEGPILERLNPANWYPATMHPNDLGHRCTAAVLTPWLTEHFEQLSPPSEHVAPSIDCEIIGQPVEARRKIPQISDELFIEQGDGERCVSDGNDPRECFDEDSWVGGELKGAAQRLIVPLGLFMLGGLLVALGIVRLRPRQWWLQPLLPDLPIRNLTRNQQHSEMTSKSGSEPASSHVSVPTADESPTPTQLPDS